MKKFIITAILAAASVASWALPNPKQIESALAAKDYVSARSLVDEVLRAQPQSARAHLLNAYILEHAERNPNAAASELKLARTLDTKGDVKNSSLFGRTVAELDMQRSTVVAPPPVAYQAPVQAYQPLPPVAQAAPPADTGHGFLFWMFWIALLGGGGYFIYRKLDKAAKDAPMAPSYAEESQVSPAIVAYSDPVPTESARETIARKYPNITPRRVQPSYQAPAPVQAPQVVVVHDNGGSGLGTAMAVGGGLLAADILLSNSREAAYERGRRDANRSYPSPTYNNPVYNAPVAPAAPAVDFQTEADSFSSGSNDSWTPSPASRDDDVSSSSSSSSSWTDSSSSSSSSDSGSSDSGGSDW